MPKIHFGHCIGCDAPIPPPYLSFKVMHVHGNGNSITEWEEVDVCDDCGPPRTCTVSSKCRTKRRSSMPLTPDIERANALVDLAALLKKADNIREKYFRDRPIHVTGFDVELEGKIRTVRPMSFCDGVKLEIGSE